MKNLCQYCFYPFDNEKHKRTAEHIIPRGLIELFPDQYVTFLEDKMFIDNRGMTIADVYKHCNCTLLSPLDSYGVNLIRSHFMEPISALEYSAIFPTQIDYYGLSRWILKILYNNQRARKANIKWFQSALGYILLGTLVENISFSIFAGIHVNTSALPESAYNYLPLQINEEPKILGNSLGVASFGMDPYVNSVKVKGAQGTFCLRMGTAIFYCILWDKVTSVNIKNEYDVLFQKKFNFIKLKSYEDSYDLKCISAHSNTTFGYNHLISLEGLKQDRQIIQASIGGREPQEAQDLFLSFSTPKNMEEGQTLVEAAIFPDNKRIQSKYKKLFQEQE